MRSGLRGIFRVGALGEDQVTKAPFLLVTTPVAISAAFVPTAVPVAT